MPIQKETSNAGVQPPEPDSMSTNPPFLSNAIIYDKTGEVDIGALVHGIEVLEQQLNAITCPETGKQLEYCHHL